MSGLITSSLNGFRGSMNMQPYKQLYWDPTKEQEWVPQTIDYNPNVSERSGEYVIRGNIDLETFKRPETKPNPFYMQQDKIIRFIPPIQNDTYLLETDNVVIPKNKLPGFTQPANDAYKSIRDQNLIETSRPLAYGTGKQNKAQPVYTRPEVDVYETRLAPNVGRTIHKTVGVYKTIPNNSTPLPIPQVPSYQVLKAPKYLQRYSFAPKQIVPLNVNVISPKRISNPSFAKYGPMC